MTYAVVTDSAATLWSLHLGSALSSTVEVARLCVLAAVGALRRDRDADVGAVVTSRQSWWAPVGVESAALARLMFEQARARVPGELLGQGHRCCRPSRLRMC